MVTGLLRSRAFGSSFFRCPFLSGMATSSSSESGGESGVAERIGFTIFFFSSASALFMVGVRESERESRPIPLSAGTLLLWLATV